MKRVLFVINDDWYAKSHRSFLLLNSKKKGLAIGVVSKFSKPLDIFFKRFKCYNWNISRSSLNPLKEIFSIVELAKAIHDFNPDLVHAVGLKPILYAGLIKFFFKFRAVYAIAGMGFLQISNNIFFVVIRKIYLFILLFIFRRKNTKIIFQNKENYNFFKKSNIKRKNIYLIPGTGININKFKKIKKIKKRKKIVLFVSRLLYSKGIKTFVDCANYFYKTKNKAEFLIVGGIDEYSRDSVDRNFVEKHFNKKNINWVGHKKNLINYYNKSNILFFPSKYGEGLPRVLLEAASCELPALTYNVAGCKDFVVNNYNGFLAKGSNNFIFNKINQLLTKPAVLKKAGKNARNVIKVKYSEKLIFDKTFEVWNSD